MVFSSAVFVFVFFPAVFILYRVIPGIKAKNVLLTVASLIFYTSGQAKHLPLLLFSVLCNYAAGRLMMRETKYRRAVVVIALVVNLALIGFYKYLGFIIVNINSLFSLNLPAVSIELPIGISFFTFQGLSYTLDVYRDKNIATRNFAKLLLYISFFPQLIAGPIIIYHDVAAQIDSRFCTPSMTAEGLRRFVFGLSKKLLLANPLGRVADTMFALPSAALDSRAAWIGALCYTLQIYFDFSGYSDMALGLGKCFGFTFLENFNYPYTAASIQAFWRRWHMSLSYWFRDYLYIPLGGNRKGNARRMLNRCIVFFCTGLWHGASWNFVIWGLWHGFFILLEDFLPLKKWNRIFGIVYTLLVVICGFVIFRANDLQQAWAMLGSMFSGFHAGVLAGEVLRRTVNGYNLFIFIAAVLAAGGAAPAVQHFFKEKAGRLLPWGNWLAYSLTVPLLILCIMDIASSTFNPFIYFRF